jgi:hypothetical protein
MIRDRAAKLGTTGRIGVVELADRRRPQPSGDELRPQPERKQVERGDAKPERTRRTADSPRGQRCGGQGGAASGQLRMLVPRVPSRRRLLGQIVRQLALDKRSGPVARRDVPFRDQLLVGQQRRGPRHTQVVGEAARRGQTRIGREGAVENGPADREIDLLLKTFPRAIVDADQQPVRQADTVVT